MLFFDICKFICDFFSFFVSLFRGSQPRLVSLVHSLRISCGVLLYRPLNPAYYAGSWRFSPCLVGTSCRPLPAGAPSRCVFFYTQVIDDEVLSVTCVQISPKPLNRVISGFLMELMAFSRSSSE